jgi:DNA-binding transcriptional LysR family regulator
VGRTLEATAVTYFREVGRVGSIARAATNLFIAPSAISRQIRLLEDDLGVELFHRGRRGMSITVAGQMFLAFTEKTSAEEARLRTDLGTAGEHLTGIVTVATTEALNVSLIPDALGRLAESHPRLSVKVVTAGSNSVAAAVAARDADLGFIFGPPPRADVVALGTQNVPLFLMVRPGHALDSLETVDFSTLAQYAMALPDSSYGIRQEVDRACAEQRVELLVKYEANSLALLKELAIRADVAIFLPVEGAVAELQSRALVAIPISHRRMTSTKITLIRSPGHHESPFLRPAQDAFIQTMRSFVHVGTPLRG